MGITKTPTWQRLDKNWGNGWDSLTQFEQEALALWWLEAETMNGTLNQFFWNSSGDLALIALAGLEAFNMPITLAAYQSALSFFGETYPLDREKRMAQLTVIENQFGVEVFTPASRIIQDLPEDFVQAAVDRLTVIYKL